jgi:glycerol uptake facilitator-like aquaporin
VATIIGFVRLRPAVVAPAVGLYITAAYWFTASTSFANPAVTVAHTLTDTFAGSRPVDAPAFVATQLVGAVLATWLMTWLLAPGAEDELAGRVPEPAGAARRSKHTRARPA